MIWRRRFRTQKTPSVEPMSTTPPIVAWAEDHPPRPAPRSVTRVLGIHQSPDSLVAPLERFGTVEAC